MRPRRKAGSARAARGGRPPGARADLDHGGAKAHVLRPPGQPHRHRATALAHADSGLGVDPGGQHPGGVERLGRQRRQVWPLGGEVRPDGGAAVADVSVVVGAISSSQVLIQLWSWFERLGSGPGGRDARPCSSASLPWRWGSPPGVGVSSRSAWTPAASRATGRGVKNLPKTNDQEAPPARAPRMGPTVHTHHGLPTPGKAAAPQPSVVMAMRGPRSRAGLMQAMVSGASTMMMKAMMKPIHRANRGRLGAKELRVSTAAKTTMARMKVANASARIAVGVLMMPNGHFCAAAMAGFGE